MVYRCTYYSNLLCSCYKLFAIYVLDVFFFFLKVSIAILDENDNSPEFDLTSDLSVNVPEDTTIGQRVAMVTARDKDAGKNGLVRERRRSVCYQSYSWIRDEI